MRFMNVQITRVGKLQLELDQDQAATMTRALDLASTHDTDPQHRQDAAQLAVWVRHRRFRRWGHTGD